MIVIDTPPHADLAASKAAECADLVLVPCRPSAFDLAAMTRIAVGPPWTGFSQPDQAALTEAFTRWSIATYAALNTKFANGFHFFCELIP